MIKDKIPAVSEEDCMDILREIAKSAAKQFHYTDHRKGGREGGSYEKFTADPERHGDFIFLENGKYTIRLQICRNNAYANVSFRKDKGCKFYQASTDIEKGLRWAKVILDRYEREAAKCRGGKDDAGLCQDAGTAEDGTGSKSKGAGREG